MLKNNDKYLCSTQEKTSEGISFNLEYAIIPTLNAYLSEGLKWKIENLK